MEQIFNWIKEQKVLCGFLFLVILCGIFASLYLVEVTAEEAYVCPKTEISSDTEEANEIIVDIKGAVVNPGIYHLKSNAIVQDVITLAGGLSEDADTSNLNLSKKVTDEMVITVYTHEEVKDLEKQEAIVETENESKDDDDTTTTSGLVSINTASLEELMTLPGIGEAKAKSIIQYRENCGKFAKKEDLLNISGIGEKVYAELEAYITI